MRRTIARTAAALLAVAGFSLLLPVSEAQAFHRRRGGGGCGCSSSCDSCGGGGGCTACTTGGSYSTGYRGTDYNQAPTPAQGQSTYDSSNVPPAPSGSNSSMGQGGSATNPKSPSMNQNPNQPPASPQPGGR